MNYLENNLKNKIMRRVYAIWILKRVFSLSSVRMLAFIALFIKFIKEVSVLNVIHNLPSITNIIDNFNYLSYAVTNTEASVQLYLTGIMVIVTWFIADLLLKKIPFIGITGSRLPTN